jgi:chorismate mutase
VISTELEALRSEIDQLDEELVQLLARSFAVSPRVGALKRTSPPSPRDSGREALQWRRNGELAGQQGVSPELAESLLRLMVERVVLEHQQE